MYLEKLLAASRAADPGLALAVVQVPEYTRGTAKGNIVKVHSYSRLGQEGMQSHLTGAHGMHAGAFGHDFAHPQSLAAWHGTDHFARGAAVGHSHADESPVRAQHPLQHAEASAGGHPGAGMHGGHLPGLLGHMAAWEVPAFAHREIRRTADRQVRRRLQGLLAKPPGGSPPAAPSGGASGGSGGSGSSSSSSSGSSSGSGR